MQKIVTITYGSHLYGTNHPESDLDVRSVFMPSSRDVLLGRIPRTQNTCKLGDSDEQDISLHYFVELAKQGQTMAIEMLFAGPQFTVINPDYLWCWHALLDNRRLFLSKNMKAFIGYARGQAAKYSLKGDRLNKLHKFHSILLKHDGYERKLSEIWDKLPKDAERINPQGIRELQIAGKWFGENTSRIEVSNSITKLISRYGNRSQFSAESNGCDWKALSHAVRVSHEVLDLFLTENIEFPLYYASKLKGIRQGLYSLEEIQNMLDCTLEAAELAMKNSSLPETVNGAVIDELLLELVNKEIFSK